LLASQKMESSGVLAGGIAHDFNNLLTSVIGNAELAQHLLPAGSPARAHVELSPGASGRAAELPRRLRAQAGTGRYAPGLGLPAVLGLVRAHRGMLSVESAPGAGSTFRIWLPAAPGATASVRRAVERPRGRILVVDDEPTVREVLVGLLSALGYQVDCAV